MTVSYLLFYDRDNGASESWNHNYTPVEAFLDDGDRKKRIEFLKTILSEDTDYMEQDVDILEPCDLKYVPTGNVCLKNES